MSGGVGTHEFGTREDAAVTDLETAGTSRDSHTLMGLTKGMVQRLGEVVDALDALPTLAAIEALAARDGYEADARAGNILIAHNPAAQAVSVALTTTYTGLCISNPIGSRVDLVMLGCNFALSLAPAAIASLHLIAGYSDTTDVVHTAPLAAPGIRSSKLGPGGSSVAKADSQATIVNPGYFMPMGSGFTAAALYATTPGWIDLRRIPVVPPGGWIAWGALTAVTGFGGFAWKEVPAS